MLKLVVNVKYLLSNVIFFNCDQILEFKAHSRYHKGALTQKETIFSDLYYISIWFSWPLKRSKQTFNTKFVIWRPVHMTGTWHQSLTKHPHLQFIWQYLIHFYTEKIVITMRTIVPLKSLHTLYHNDKRFPQIAIIVDSLFFFLIEEIIVYKSNVIKITALLTLQD